jgi:8-oxo-dGTP pyrophosphatase MutT (NUDIX family)
VVREAMEEMGRTVIVGKKVGTYETDTPEGGFDVSLFFCEMEGDPIEGLEPGKIGGFEWLTLDELADLAEKNAAGDLSRTLVPNVIAALPELAEYL